MPILLTIIETVQFYVKHLLRWFYAPVYFRHRHKLLQPANGSKHRHSPKKPEWIKAEILRLKALMTQAECHSIADICNCRFSVSRQVTVGKTYVHQVLHRNLKHATPEAVPRNLIWRIDLTGKADASGSLHFLLGILDHQLGITSLNYAMGTFERNGQLSQLSSPDLAADTEGTITYTVPEGIIVQTSNGKTSLLATRIDDKSVIEANRDGVTGYEDTELIISAADLMANDTLAGFSGANLSITGVSGFTHGSGFLDGNGFVHYTPDADYFGAAQFDYTIRAVTGQRMAANDNKWFCERWAA